MLLLIIALVAFLLHYQEMIILYKFRYICELAVRSHDVQSASWPTVKKISVSTTTVKFKRIYIGPLRLRVLVSVMGTRVSVKVLIDTQY